MKNSILTAALFLVVKITIFAQVGINTDNSVPDASAMLDVKSTDRGMLTPRMSTSQRTAISSPATGLLVFDNNTSSFWYYTGSDWSDLSTSSDLLWEVSSGFNITNKNLGNVGIGNLASTQNRWQLTVKDTVDCMLGQDSIDVSELFGVFTRNLNENNTGIGIGFQSTSTVTGMGAAIVHERTNSNSRGKLHFATKSSGSAADEDLPIRMTIDETGEVGFGTTAPTAAIDVVGDGIISGKLGIGETTAQASLDVVDQAVIGDVAVGSESTDQGLSSASGQGFTTTPWLYTNAIEAQGERGSASTLITLGADGRHGVADEIHFVTSGNSQMKVSSDGKIGIDKDPDTDIHIRQSQQSIENGTGGIKFENSSDATDYWRMYHSGIFLSFNLEGSRVAYVNTNGAWTVDSDLNLKKNISSLNPALDRIMELRPVKYHYKEQSNDANKSLGFIAQEVLPHFPEMVVEGEDGKLGMSYSYAGVIAIKAIQEQQTIIEEQNKMLKEQEIRMKKLEEEMLALKALITK